MTTTHPTTNQLGNSTGVYGGGTLQYGKLSINQVGIGNGKEVVPWSQVKGVQISNGSIAVQKEGKWLAWTNVAVARTPNFFIFLTLVNQIMGVRA